MKNGGPEAPGRFGRDLGGKKAAEKTGGSRAEKHKWKRMRLGKKGGPSKRGNEKGIEKEKREGVSLDYPNF